MIRFAIRISWELDYYDTQTFRTVGNGSRIANIKYMGSQTWLCLTYIDGNSRLPVWKSESSKYVGFKVLSSYVQA